MTDLDALQTLCDAATEAKRVYEGTKLGSKGWTQYIATRAKRAAKWTKATNDLKDGAAKALPQLIAELKRLSLCFSCGNFRDGTASGIYTLCRHCAD